MTVYMLKSEHGWYKKSGHWTKQEYASIWTTKSGPAGSKGHINRRLRRVGQSKLEMETVEFELVEKQ